MTNDCNSAKTGFADYISSISQIEELSKKLMEEEPDPVQYDGSIVLPPPNVTGNLHLGHALNGFITDAKVRHLRLNGQAIRWIPGTDHAGIGTQMLVKAKLLAEGKNPTDAELLEAVWAWKSHFEENIISQFKKMNLMLDWDSYKFTFSQDMIPKVADAFCKMYHQGLIFREKRMVNWDVSLQTVLSDIECVNKEMPGTLWYIKYFTEKNEFIEVATTRPETLFADAAVAVHPDDPRYKDLVGKKVKVPLINKWVPVITSHEVEIDKGSGALKIDPAHAFLDFTLGCSHGLEIIQVIDKFGKMASDLPEWVRGLDRFEARKAVVTKLKNHELISREDAINQLVPCGEKSGSVLEPMVMEQWFMDMPKLAKRCLDLVQDGDLELIPEHFKNLYNHYMKNLHPWCISRQLVWGHRIPVWYKEDGSIIVARNQKEAELIGGKSLTKDPDVFDTWFSSALWPMATSNTEPEQRPYMIGYYNGYPEIIILAKDDVEASLQAKYIAFEECKGFWGKLIPNGKKQITLEYGSYKNNLSNTILITNPTEVGIIRTSILDSEFKAEPSNVDQIKAIVNSKAPELVTEGVKITTRGKIYKRFWKDETGRVFAGNSEADLPRNSQKITNITYLDKNISNIIKTLLIEEYVENSDEQIKLDQFIKTNFDPEHKGRKDLIYTRAVTKLGENTYLDSLQNMFTSNDPNEIKLRCTIIELLHVICNVGYDWNAGLAFVNQLKFTNAQFKEISQPIAWRTHNGSLIVDSDETSARIQAESFYDDNGIVNLDGIPELANDIRLLKLTYEPRRDYFIQTSDNLDQNDKLLLAHTIAEAKFLSTYIKIRCADKTILEARFNLSDGTARITRKLNDDTRISLRHGELVRRVILDSEGYCAPKYSKDLVEAIRAEFSGLEPVKMMVCGKVWSRFWDDGHTLFGADDINEARLRSSIITTDKGIISFKMNPHSIASNRAYLSTFQQIHGLYSADIFHDTPFQAELLLRKIEAAQKMQAGLNIEYSRDLLQTARVICEKRVSEDDRLIVWIDDTNKSLIIEMQIAQFHVDLIKEVMTTQSPESIQKLQNKLGCTDVKLQSSVVEVIDIKQWLADKRNAALQIIQNKLHNPNLRFCNDVVRCDGFEHSNEFLVTGSDILFFWVTKMIQANLALGLAKVPFKQVYLHGLVQDAYGKKMSKSKGNVVNPLDLFDEEGIDVVRFSLLGAATAGRNVKFGQPNLDKSRKFLIKIWNAMNLCLTHSSKHSTNITHPANLWILARIAQVKSDLDAGFAKWDIYNNVEKVYAFFWDEFCSNYIEIMKYLLKTNYADETKYCVHIACTELMRIMHPFIPFITQYFWSQLGMQSIFIDRKLPSYNSSEFEKTITLWANIRALTKNFGIPAGSQVYVDSQDFDLDMLSFLTKYKMEFGTQETLFAMDGVKISFHKADVEDLEAKRSKIIDTIDKEISLLQNKVNDQGFITHADPKEVEQIKSRLHQLDIDRKIYDSRR